MFGLKLGGGSKNGIGLEINSERVNVAQLRRKGQSSYKLAAFASAELPEGAVQEGRINDPAAIGETIRTLLTEKKIKAKNVATSVPGRETVSRLIRLPSEIPDAELREMVLNQEASLYLPFPREDADVTYQKLGTTLDEDGIERTEILMVATPKEVTDNYIQVLEYAQLKPDIIEVSSFALIRSLHNELVRFSGASQAVAVVDIECEMTEINVTVDGVPQFSRSIPTGTVQIQNAQLRAMNMPGRRITDPELMANISVPIQTMDTAGLAGGMSGSSPGDAAVLRVVGDLADELRRSIDFYTNQSSGSDVAQIFLVGPGACINQLDDYLSQRLGIEAEPIDPLSALSVSVDRELSMEERYGMSIALGLGVREV
jgi:type IV pilus assembly protein PilM